MYPNKNINVAVPVQINAKIDKGVSRSDAGLAGYRLFYEEFVTVYCRLSWRSIDNSKSKFETRLEKNLTYEKAGPDPKIRIKSVVGRKLSPTGLCPRKINPVFFAVCC